MDHLLIGETVVINSGVYRVLDYDEKGEAILEYLMDAPPPVDFQKQDALRIPDTYVRQTVDVRKESPDGEPDGSNPCRCSQCRVRVAHWTCDICRGRTSTFAERTPFFTRYVRQVGSQSLGIRYACSAACTERERGHAGRQQAEDAARRGDMEACRAARRGLFTAG